MRVIEEKMVAAVRRGETLSLSNTTVTRFGKISLHGNHIATCFDNGIITVNLETLRRWPTPTTKSRLRALGIPVYTKNYQCYIGEKSIDDIPSNFVDVDGVVL